MPVSLGAGTETEKRRADGETTADPSQKEDREQTEWAA